MKRKKKKEEKTQAATERGDSQQESKLQGFFLHFEFLWILNA